MIDDIAIIFQDLRLDIGALCFYNHLFQQLVQVFQVHYLHGLHIAIGIGNADVGQVCYADILLQKLPEHEVQHAALVDVLDFPHGGVFLALVHRFAGGGVDFDVP